MPPARAIMEKRISGSGTPFVDDPGTKRQAPPKSKSGEKQSWAELVSSGISRLLAKRGKRQSKGTGSDSVALRSQEDQVEASRPGDVHNA
jgi:hypothetical protein